MSATAVPRVRAATTGPATGHQAAGPGGPGDWRLGPAFLLRVAGLPVETVRRLRCPAGRRWADAVLAESDRLRADGEAVGDLLHDLIGRNEDETSRRRLLAVRRAVFNNRLPREPEAALAHVRSLDGPVGRALDHWLTGRTRLAALLDEGGPVLAEELAASRDALRGLAGDERLRAGVLLASPSLDAQLDGYLRAGDGPPDKRQRKIERSLLAYLYRTACKTSPFSTFTALALGDFTGSGTGAGREVRVDGAWHSHPRLNVVALGRLTDAVLADPARCADLPVSPASGWGREDDRVRYVRRWTTAGDEDSAVTFDAVKDRLFFLRRSGTLDRLLALFERRPVLRHGELARWLAAESGESEEECARYLEALLRLGMVQVPSLHTTVYDTDPLLAFRQALRTLDRPWAGELAEVLAAPAGAALAYPHAPLTERRRLLGELRRQLGEVQNALGARDAKVPQTVLYEDVVADAPVAMDREAFTELAAEPLRAVERVLPAFDLTLPQRVTFKGFFVARHGRGGRCEDLLKLVHDFHEDFFDQYLTFTSRRRAYDEQGRYTPEENWLGLPQLRALDSARQTFTAHMRELWEHRGAEPELGVPAGALDEVAAELEPLSSDFVPLSHHLQLADRAEDPLVVLNRSYGGLSFPFSRFTHCFDGLSERLRAHNAGLEPEGAVFAEVTGGPVTSNLNLHGRLTDHEIVCPGERGTLPPERRLHLEDLYLVHDEEADRLVLRSTRLGREVVPVYLGYLVPLALPEVPRTLLLLSPTSMAPVDVWAGVPEGEPVDGVTHRPRVRHGALVLSRRRWSAPAAALPLRAPGTSDAEWFLGWHRFRRRHGLPDRVFATVSGGGARGATGAKPSYVDFDSVLSLTAFEALLASAEARVVLREALPDEDALHTVTPEGRHVAELAVETVRGGGTPASRGEGTERKDVP
ncbi:lantibiotic dehydratase [Streptomyces chumphonensis]|uniref:lantibiotic dehydratase n=1 Tax=Streptomyces chumphonensis TaxID=1214925 RepID=UPI003D72B7D2